MTHQPQANEPSANFQLESWRDEAPQVGWNNLLDLLCDQHSCSRGCDGPFDRCQVLAHWPGF
jgi:hypothetical protein